VRLLIHPPFKETIQKTTRDKYKLFKFMKDNYDAIASYFYQHYGNVMNKSDLKEFSVFGIFSVVQLEHWNTIGMFQYGFFK